MAKRDNTWTNKDGLYVGFGTRKTEKNTSSAHAPSSGIQTLEMRIRGADLGDTVAAADLENAAVIPQGALLLSADLFVTTAFAGASAVLDIGTYNADANDIADDDGIDVAIATATLTDGAVVSCDGADVGVVCDGTDGWKLGASYDTAAFTAGEATLVCRYIVAASPDA
jgi:hypothetical protein